MQGQSSPVKVKDLLVKDPYTGSIFMHVGSFCKTHRTVQCTPPKNNQKLIKKKNDYYINKTPHVSALTDHSQHLKL